MNKFPLINLLKLMNFKKKKEKIKIKLKFNKKVIILKIMKLVINLLF